MPKENDMSQNHPDMPYKSKDELDAASKKKDGPTTAELMESINGLQTQLGQLAEENKRLSATNQTLLSNPAGNVPEDEPKAPGPIDLKGLPDSYSDPEGHAAELNKRIQSAITANVDYATQKQQRAQRAAASEAQRADNLWDAFSTAYPDLSKNESMVKVAAVEVVDAARKRGMDTNSYMYKTTDLFLADVAKQIKDKYSPMLKTDTDQETEPEPNRTGGLHGGGQQAKTDKDTSGDEEPGDFAAELQEVQRGMGIF